MCGIVGYVGERQALPILLEGLRCLEYRGYDSAGVAVRTAAGTLAVCKRQGRVEALARASESAGRGLAGGRAGIGHTRWATHGRPSDENAHPHLDEGATVAVVHNGIIENHAELRAELAARGHTFRSETDSEVVVHLLEEALAGGEGPPGERLRGAVQVSVTRLRGSFALAVLWAAAPDLLIGARQQTPLVIGRADGETHLASDVTALLPYTREVVVLLDGELAEVRSSGVQLYAFDGRPLPERAAERVAWDASAAQRGGYAHFMLKEIHEQPAALAETVRGRLGHDRPAVPECASGAAARALATSPRAVLLGCGTAYHAALTGRRLFERWARLPCAAELGSEFRYADPIVGRGDLAVAVSQSGETADTLAALREARSRGAVGLAVVNVVGSTLAREADTVLYTCAGPEVAVASTKAYTTQIAALALLALEAAVARGTMTQTEVAAWTHALRQVPVWVEAALALEPDCKALAANLARAQHCFFMGRGLDWATAMEGQLKLKEVSYLHAEAYAAGELKHGTLALVTDGMPVVALFTQPGLAAKTASNAAEVRARGGHVVGVATPAAAAEAESQCAELLLLPDVPADLAPLVAAVPLQLLAYHTAVARGTDVDKPRNLAKSVTVE